MQSDPRDMEALFLLWWELRDQYYRVTISYFGNDLSGLRISSTEDFPMHRGPVVGGAGFYFPGGVWSCELWQVAAIAIVVWMMALALF